MHELSLCGLVSMLEAWGNLVQCTMYDALLHGDALRFDVLLHHVLIYSIVLPLGVTIDHTMTYHG